MGCNKAQSQGANDAHAMVLTLNSADVLKQMLLGRDTEKAQQSGLRQTCSIILGA